MLGTRRTAALATLAAACVTAGLAVSGPAPTADRTASGPPAFFVASTARAADVPAPRAVAGTRTLVTLRTALLPERAAGQRLGFRLGDRALTGRFTRVEHHAAYTSWTGTLEDEPLGSFTVVRAGSTYRASIRWPGGLWTLTQGAGTQYWLTDVAPQAPSTADDVATRRMSGARPAAPAPRRKKGTVKVDVLFAYTAAAKAEAGGKAGITAAVGQVVADTNLAMANSETHVKVRAKGIVKVKGTESQDAYTNLRRLEKPGDGQFDKALKIRVRKHADLVHLITSGSTGPNGGTCGWSRGPSKPRYAVPQNGLGTSFLSCLPYLVTTHELGHNFGADHFDYPGVSHNARMKGAYAYIDQPHHFLTVMGGYEPCAAVGDYTCVRIPYFSNPDGSYGGFPIGSTQANNAKIVRKIGPLVARYSKRLGR